MFCRGFVWYVKNLLIAIDQLINAIFGGFCDESLSSRAYKHYLRGDKWLKVLIDTILFFDKDHCKESYRSELERRQLPPEMRK